MTTEQAVQCKDLALKSLRNISPSEADSVGEAASPRERPWEGRAGGKRGAAVTWPQASPDVGARDAGDVPAVGGDEVQSYRGFPVRGRVRRTFEEKLLREREIPSKARQAASASPSMHLHRKRSQPAHIP